MGQATSDRLRQSHICRGDIAKRHIADLQVPVMVVVDRYNALHTESFYGQTINDHKRLMIPAAELRLARAMRILERDPPPNGVHLAAPARHDRISQRTPVRLRFMLILLANSSKVPALNHACGYSSGIPPPKGVYLAAPARHDRISQHTPMRGRSAALSALCLEVPARDSRPKGM